VTTANVIFGGGTSNVAGTYDVSGTTTVSGGTANLTAVTSATPIQQTLLEPNPGATWQLQAG
jgi:hypothetical protein